MRNFIKDFFNNKEKGKVKGAVISVTLVISILTNLYLYTSPQSIPQNTQVVAASQGSQKQIEDLKVEKEKLSTEINDLTIQKNEIESKLNSIIEENKNLSSKLSQFQSQKSQEQTNGQASNNIQQQSQQVQNNNNNNYIVYKTRTGSKYHRSGCSYLSRSCYETTRSEAEAEGLTPCSKCRP
ncbi:hypothetical protein [Clostridium scatologenes]|uniref:Uncharacterized protein n=1 Tax=Clostridium scatologenes TaxID=1548 RepID=A0A0E3JPY3_CLOSL|nr:hypothetical protein [Clostridium scatologenes]AKA70567.1 hypothetical protein CSCA_3442 [Clostridium scatologenes]